MKHDHETIETLLTNKVPYSVIAASMGMTKSNVAKIAAQLQMKVSGKIGRLELKIVKQRYIDEVEPIETIAADAGVSVIMLRRFLQVHDLHRDRGAIYRAGTKSKHNKGVRVPGSVRDLKSKAASFMGDEHKAKLAAAKKGKTGEASNRWLGGHEIGGYVGAGSGKEKTYEHRVIAERLLGRALSFGEQVHHIDCDRKNNAPDNLLVLMSGDHTRLHVAMRKYNNLDQRAWLTNNDIQFEDLIKYA